MVLHSYEEGNKLPLKKFQNHHSVKKLHNLGMDLTKWTKIFSKKAQVFHINILTKIKGYLLIFSLQTFAFFIIFVFHWNHDPRGKKQNKQK